MLKSSKLSHKPHKSSKDSSMRKGHLSKKSLHSRSPVRVSGGSRPTSMKHISPGMKQGHLIPKRKSSHSPRLRSIASSPHRSLSHRSKPESPVSIDRVRSMKGLKYEKRKLMSDSPIRHLGPNAARRPVSPPETHSIPPYAMERYQSSSAILHQSEYSSPTRKKPRREAERYFTRSISASPPRRHTVGSSPERHISPRHAATPPPVHHKHRRNIPVAHGEREKSYEIRPKRRDSSPLEMPSNRMKEPPVKASYANENSRYRSASPDNSYPSSASKPYGPTLHERFSSVIVPHRSEPRVRYSREDLEKITIDIRRNPRDPSPTLRHIVNPAEIKLVRRANEGRRPIFDREEIKQASRDLREDAYYERKVGDSYNSTHPIDLREVENYQITRHRFDDHPNVLAGSGRSLSDRFPSHAGRKEVASLDRDERDKEYQRIPVSRGYVGSRSRSRSGDRDFRSERYLDVKTSLNRSDYQRLPVDPSESRITYAHRKSSMPLDARHKLSVKKSERENHSSSVHSESKNRYPPENRHYSDTLPIPRVERREPLHSPEPEPHKWHFKSRSPSREKFSDYSRRPEKYGYKSWIDKPDIPPKSPEYFVESREPPGSYVSRGSSRPFRSSRGFRTRGFRGPMRGNSYYRGSFRGYRSSSSPRGRGIPRR